MNEVYGILQLSLLLLSRTVLCGDECPSKCLCTDHRRYVICSDRGLDRVPDLFLHSARLLDLRRNHLAVLNFKFKLQLLETLLLDYNQLYIVSSHDFRWFPNLRKLSLRGNHLSHISSWDLDGNTRLTYIDLSFNQISTFPLDIIFRIHRLKYLSLRGNRLNNLTSNYSLPPRRMMSFRLKDMKIDLDLSDNNLTLQKQHLLQLASNIKTLKLSGNRPIDVQQLRLIAISLKHSRVQVLALERLRILQFSNFIFSNVILHRLVNLRLCDNFISILSAGTFDPLESLSSLDISRNHLTEIPNLLKNRRLEKLNLNDNLISGFSLAPALPPSLQVLLLNKNQLSVFDTTVFHRLTSLQRLEVADNKIKKFDISWTGLTELQHLNLAGNWAENHIAREIMEKLRRLLTLDLSRNSLTSLEQNFCSQHPNLDRLNLSGNRIAQLRSVDIGARAVSVLDLSHNRISILHDYVMPRLVELYLHHNRISNVDRDAFRTSVYLKFLDISDNPLRTRIINLQRQIFRRIMPHLHILKFSGIDLDPYVRNSHWAFFLEFVELRELHLERCDIRAPPLKTERLPHKLETFSLAFNKLVDIPDESFRHVHGLKHLDLSNNNIHELRETAFIRLKRLQYVNLRGNPFVCDCGDFPKFLEWINNTNISVPGFYNDSLICAHPDLMWNQSIRSFDGTTCGAVFNSMPLIGGLVAAGLILALAAVPFLIISHFENRHQSLSDPVALHMYTPPIREQTTVRNFSV